jgi:hypothetical protein
MNSFALHKDPIGFVRQAKASAGNGTKVCTGGTADMKCLKKHRNETQAQLPPE